MTEVAIQILAHIYHKQELPGFCFVSECFIICQRILHSLWSHIKNKNTCFTLYFQKFWFLRYMLNRCK